MNKKLGLYILFSIFIFGFLPMVLYKIFSGNNVMLLDLKIPLYAILGVINGLIIKKFFAKELTGDERQRKVAILSDAVAARVALFLMIIYGVFEYSETLRPLISSFATWQILLIILVCMGISAIITAMYYAKNPHKLP